HVAELAAAVVAQQHAGRRRHTLLAVGVVGDVQVEAARVGQVDEHGAAAAGRHLEDVLVVGLELPFDVAQQHGRLGAVVVEGADEQRRDAAAVDVAPGGAVAADAAQVGEGAGLVADVAEDEGVVGGGGGAGGQRQQGGEQRGASGHGGFLPGRRAGGVSPL